MSDNAALARRWFEGVWNQGRESTMTELMDAKAVGHTHAGPIVGPAEWRAKVYDPMHASFSDIQLSVDDVLAEGDKVVVRWTARMKHTGRGMPVEPTNKTLSFTGLTWLRFKDGKMVEGWDGWDSGRMLLECGAASLHPALVAQA